MKLDRFGSEGSPVLSALYAAAFGDEWPDSSIRSLLQTPGTEALVASLGPDEDLDPAGMVLFRTILDEAEILTIGVRPDRRREGVASALLRAVHKAVQQAGAKSLFLEVGVDNPAAIALYQGFGYIQAGVRQNYYRRADGQRVNALIMKVDFKGVSLK